MEYMVTYKDADGQLISTKPLREVRKNELTGILDAKNIEYSIKECPDTLYHCPKVVFDIQKIEAARKAVKEGRDLPGVLWICGDPDKIAKKNGVVTVKTKIGERNGFVIDVWKATFDEIIAYKNQIGYKHLSPVIRKI